MAFPTCFGGFAPATPFFSPFAFSPSPPLPNSWEGDDEEMSGMSGMDDDEEEEVSMGGTDSVPTLQEPLLPLGKGATITVR